jgi:phage shock protein PspC (stress-responsive transcriptional regulator)
MKKVINITLGKIVFAIEEDAYTLLSKYLDAIKKNLSKTDDFTEIATDIESALAEKFIALKRSEKMAISSEDVDAVTREMGSPSDFGEDSATTTETKATETSHTKKRLYRDVENPVIAGVASGIAQYFDSDPVIVRLIFVISVFFNGIGILAYIILWLVVPPAETTTQKFEMRGEKVTLKEITDQVKKNFETLSAPNSLPSSSFWKTSRSVLIKIFSFFGALLRAGAHIFRYVVGLVLVLCGALGIAGLVSLYSLVLFSENILFPQEAQAIVDALSTTTLGMITIVGIFLVAVIPLLVFIIAGASLLARKNHFTTGKSITLAVVWIISFTLASTSALLQNEQVLQELNLHGFDQIGYEIQVKKVTPNATEFNAPRNTDSTGTRVTE